MFASETREAESCRDMGRRRGRGRSAGTDNHAHAQEYTSRTLSRKNDVRLSFPRGALLWFHWTTTRSAEQCTRDEARGRGGPTEVRGEGSVRSGERCSVPVVLHRFPAVRGCSGERVRGGGSKRKVQNREWSLSLLICRYYHSHYLQHSHSFTVNPCLLTSAFNPPYFFDWRGAKTKLPQRQWEVSAHLLQTTGNVFFLVCLSCISLSKI